MNLEKKKKNVIIIINGREHEVEKKKISFEELIILSFGEYKPNENTAYTVTYSKGIDKKPKGQLVAGDEVMIKEGMIFNVSRTNKS